MKKQKIIIAAIKSWNINNARKLRNKFKNKYSTIIITDKKDLNYKNIRQIGPKYIFFPHWSWIIPAKIYEGFECVVFHMTDLPFGRGGSPLQNLIARGIYKTKISAIRVVEGIDAGPVYLKKGLDLEGSASQIFKKASKIIFEDMIPHILNRQPEPVLQKGKVVNFKRRTVAEGNMGKLKNIKEIYDYIRMLDAEGYPQAFIETPYFKVEFFNAALKGECVTANVRIKKI